MVFPEHHLLQITVLYATWFSFWYLYNFQLLPRNISTEKTPRRMSFIYLLCSLISIGIAYGAGSIKYIGFFLAFGVLAIILNFIFRGRQIGRLGNSLFQTTWLYCFVGLLDYNAILLAAAFWLGHLPVFIVRHLDRRGKFIVFLMSLPVGLSLSAILVVFSHPYGLILGIFTHFFFYHLLRPVDAKYRLRIIN